METEYIINDELTLAFNKHLEIKNNNRIIFSGPFGIGKSSFLKEYFKGKENAYNIIHLFPVNYSIASNEDILLMLQYDIIYELIANNKIQLEEDTYSEIELLKMFGINKFDELFLPLFEYIPKVGKPLTNFIKILKKYKAFKFEKNEGDKSIIKELNIDLQGQKGSIYRQDAYIEFISKTLNKLKNTENGTPKKENILIIDDLDRIDPEHIFRLFNVFAAHFDLNNDQSQNKFGFDKVIFVCDIENIREIFHYKYGVNATFTGYIDKFYSIRIFYIDNRLALQHYLSENFPSLSLYTNNLLIDLLSKMIETDVINFRNIKNIKHRDSFKQILSKYDEQLYFAEVVRILAMISGDAKSLIKNLESCKERLIKKNRPNITDDKDRLRNYFTGILIPVFDYVNLNSNLSIKEFSMLRLDNMRIKGFNYTVPPKQDSKKIITMSQNTKEENNLALDSLVPYFWKILIDSVIFLLNERVIN